MKYVSLFSPGKIGKMEVRNRIVMSPMITEMAEDNGCVNQRLIDYYADRSRGGIGLIVVEASCVQPPVGRAFLPQIDLNEEAHLPGLERLADGIRKHGGRSCIQLFHAGAAHHAFMGGGSPRAPSAVSYPFYEPTLAITREEMKETRKSFIDAARRCERAGFDSVMLHMCHQYLLANFISPAWNKRTDEYGGNIENRTRFPVEVLHGIKEAVNIPVVVRINAGERWAKEHLGAEQELTLDISAETAKILEASGADAIHLSSWGFGSYFLHVVFPRKAGERIPDVAAIKRNVSIPVFAYGRLTLEMADTVIRDGKADFAAFGRQTITDPFFPQKALAGAESTIAPCINCNKCSPVSAFRFPVTGTRCSVNARCGCEGEYQYPFPKAALSKKVVVVGGGPAGMEAARVAAVRGHAVVLFEKGKKLGGQLLLGDKAEAKEDIGVLPEYRAMQMKQAGVTVKVGTEVTGRRVLDEHPDAVIVATGPQSVLPKIKGIERPNVLSPGDAIAGSAPVGSRVVVVGGGLVGLETAEVLSARGKKTVICESLPQVGVRILPPDLGWIMKVLEDNGVQIRTDVTCQEITDKGVIVTNKEGKVDLLEADTVVIAIGSRPNTILSDELKGQVPEVICVGDAKEPRWIVDATFEGFKAAYSL